MSKNTLELKNAIQGLNIKKPFDLRAQSKPTLKRPAEIEEPKNESAQVKPPQKEPARVETALPVIEREQGFFMLAHSVFENEILRNVSGDSFRIFMWMSAQAWRFRGSSGEFRASVEYVSMKCGCSRSTATRGLQDLKKNGLIECVEQNFKKGNLWRVSRIADARRYTEKDGAETEQGSKEPAQNEDEGCSNSGSSSSKMSMEAAQNEQHLINPKTSKNENNSLSVPDCLDQHLESLLAPKKRESESLALKALLETLPREQVREAFQHLETKKFKFKEAQVHSPFSFLTHAMGEVWSEVLLKKQKNFSAVDRERFTRPTDVNTKIEVEKFQLEQKEVWAKFCETYPAESDRISKLGDLLSGTPFIAQTDFGRNMALLKWSETYFSRQK